MCSHVFVLHHHPTLWFISSNFILRTQTLSTRTSHDNRKCEMYNVHSYSYIYAYRTLYSIFILMYAFECSAKTECWLEWMDAWSNSHMKSRPKILRYFIYLIVYPNENLWNTLTRRAYTKIVQRPLMHTLHTVHCSRGDVNFGGQ